MTHIPPVMRLVKIIHFKCFSSSVVIILFFISIHAGGAKRQVSVKYAESLHPGWTVKGDI
jgi:hypothetical protein